MGKLRADVSSKERYAMLIISTPQSEPTLVGVTCDLIKTAQAKKQKFY